jgi:hypothetical protein
VNTDVSLAMIHLRNSKCVFCMTKVFWRLVSPLCISIAGVIGILGILAPTLASGSSTPTMVSWSAAAWGPNAVDFSQVPGQVDTFIGRINVSSSSSAETDWNLGIGQMDWSTYSIRLARALFTLPALLPEGKTLTQALDPTIAFYNNEYWVAFECAGIGF